MSLSLEDARKIVFDLVAKHGPEHAKAVLFERIKKDPDFELVVAKHALEIIRALREAQNATLH